MSRNTISRCGVLLALVLALGLAGATPASAEEPTRGAGWDRVMGWLTGFFDLSGWTIGPATDTNGGTSGSPSRIWDMEGPGFDPNGTPILQGGTTPTTNEGPGFDPNGAH